MSDTYREKRLDDAIERMANLLAEMQRLGARNKRTFQRPEGDR
jgi:hypothetical protein